MHCLSVREDLKKNFSKEISIPVVLLPSATKGYPSGHGQIFLRQ